MKKTRIKILLIIPLLLINLFNVLFILYKVKGSGYLRESCQIVGDYFIGFHLIPVVLAVVILFSFYFFKKLESRSFTYQISLVFLLYFTAINIALFPEINTWFGERGWDFKLKKNSSLNEAISESPAKFAKVVKSYIQMNEYLRHKTLVIPFSVPIEKDYFFKVFIAPEKILKKEYKSEITLKNYKLLRNYSLKTFKAFWQLKEIDSYIIIDAVPGSDELVLFTHEKSLIFLPTGLSKLGTLNIHD
jgi:hypothetical protein